LKWRPRALSAAIRDEPYNSAQCWSDCYELAVPAGLSQHDLSIRGITQHAQWCLTSGSLRPCAGTSCTGFTACMAERTFATKRVFLHADSVRGRTENTAPVLAAPVARLIPGNESPVELCTSFADTIRRRDILHPSRPQPVQLHPQLWTLQL
jgi:hypothetical protein